MEYQTEFDEWKERIEALPLEETKLPNLPIDEFTASAETLAIEATKDKEVLGQAGLDVTLIDDLNPLSGALRFSQAIWMSEYRAQQEAQKEWSEQSPAAFELKAEFLHHFSFAYRNIPDVNKKVMRIREGGGNRDLVQDLLELAILGEINPAPLNEVGFDLAKLEAAKTLSHNLADLLAQVNGSKDESSANKILRDKAYTLLFERVSKIREYGRYVFWKNDERKEKYLKE